MVYSDVEKLCRVFEQADSGCSTCVANQVEAFNELFKDQWIIEFDEGDNWYGGGADYRKACFKIRPSS